MVSWLLGNILVIVNDAQKKRRQWRGKKNFYYRHVPHVECFKVIKEKDRKTGACNDRTFEILK